MSPKPLKHHTQNSPYVIPDQTTNDLTTCTPSQPTSFTEQIQAKFIFQHGLFKEDQQMMFQAKMSPQRHLQAL